MQPCDRMSKWRKHVTSPDYVEPPQDGQEIVKALGSRGSNLIEVELASGEQTLCLLPAKFNKKLWVKRGGFLIVALGDVAATESVSGTIVHVLYEADVRRLKAMPSVWPPAFDSPSPTLADSEDTGVNLDSLQAALPEADRSRDDLPRHNSATLKDHPGSGDLSCRSSQCSAYSESDSDLPPLRPNKNRPIREYEYTDDETSSDDGT